MKKPRLAEFAQMAEVVAAVAVVVSLSYVGRELRTNTIAIRGAAQQSITSAQAEIVLLEASDSAVARIRQIGDADPSRLTEAEAFRYHLLLRQIWINLQNVYLQNELGLIDSRLWNVNHRTTCGVWSSAGVQATWPAHLPVLDEGFAALVEACPRTGGGG